MVYFVHGDIFKSTAQTLVNPVNCVGVMGAGLAKQFKERYPAMYSKYVTVCKKNLLEPGKLMICKEEDHWVLLFPTKTNYSLPSKIEYIESGLKKLAESYQSRGITSIAIPKIGCGLGGLDLETVKALVVQHLNKLPIDVLFYV